MPTPPFDTSTHARSAHPGTTSGLLAGAAEHPDDRAAADAAARRSHRRQRIGAFLVAVAAVALAAGAVSQVAFTEPGGDAAPTVAVAAESTGVLVIRPGEAPDRIAIAKPVASASASGNIVDSAAAARHAVGVDETVAVVERSRSRAAINASSRRTSASATIERISLLGGRVELSGAQLQATASSTDGRATGAFTLDPATTLTVDGAATKISPNQRIAVEGIGTVLVNEQAVLAAAPTGDEQTGPRARVVGAIAHLRLTSEYAGLPAGTQVIVGRVDAGVREGKVRTTEHPGAATPVPRVAAPAGVTAIQPGAPRPGDATLPRLGTSVRGTTTTVAAGSLQNYTFPVLGSVAYSNDWGGARASTGIPHQGTDIFADEGTPIVATADGVLDRVGWNSIGGYRFWLFDRFGNSFYHAHLSAYSPLAQDGAQVRAGDVIGFVGHTGDAQGTPPHLHFEVHPGNGEPSNPFPFLNAWQRGVAVAIGLLSGGETRTASLSLLGFTDISANSGLQESVLDTVPETTERPVEGENVPQPTDETLRRAIEGPGTSPTQ
ncbi:MAG: Peptidase [Thermoleophilia bacterium]|nr:Peptidase [Thermoleophilia bacterium]